MKNIFLKSVFSLLLILVIAGFSTVHGQTVNLTINDSTDGAALDKYIISAAVYSLSPYTTYPCTGTPQPFDPYSTFSNPFVFYANVNDVKIPVFYARVRVERKSQSGILVGSGDNYVGPMTTAQLQGSWSITVNVTP
jgi:hypothetical protein